VVERVTRRKSVPTAEGQVLINNQFQERLNQIIKFINSLSNSIRKDSYINTEIPFNLQNQIRIAKEEIINVKYAIQWAKLNVIEVEWAELLVAANSSRN